MKKFVKCKHCGNCEFIEIDTSIAEFNNSDENEYLQNECFKLQKELINCNISMISKICLIGNLRM